MAVYLKTDNLSSTDEESCNLVPFNLEMNGSANIDSYFKTSIRQDNENLTASFRGRPLNGKTISLPSGYSGIVVKELHRPVTEDEDREFTATHKFKEMTYWNLDKVPSSDDRFAQALNWIDIARAVHRPVDEESSQKSVMGK